MDVTVSIHDWKSLSQSEIIVRHLYAILQIGQTVRKGNGLSMYNAEFRSGSAEIPLILSIKNSQTETTMYVRNIPMSAVLDRGGLQQRWVGVYPPGDPLNLHFDPTQPPRDGSPQVCLSVAVHEDLLATVANVPVADPFASAASSGAFGSWRFSPEHRLSELPSSDKVDQLRRSITSLQAEMKLSQDRGDGERGVAFGRESLLPVAGGSHHGSRNSHSELMPGSDLAPWPSISGAAKTGKVELDSWLKEKERQAQKIKEHVEDMAKAQRRAEDVGRDLQEQLDLLAELRRRSRSAEASLVESKLQLQDLERQRDSLQQEEVTLKDEICLRDQDFQELRTKRDDADRQLSRALAEQGLQRNNLEASAKSFHLQAQIIAQDIDQSKRHVLELKSSLLGKQAIIEDHQKNMQEEENVRAGRQATKRIQLESELDQTRGSLAKAQAGLEVSRLQLQETETRRKETTKRLEIVQKELECLKSEDGDSPVRSSATDAKAVLLQKQSKLSEQELQVQRLEFDLKESREMLEKHSQRMADVHAEATECEMKNKCLEEKKLQLQKELDERKLKVLESIKEKEVRQKQLDEAEKYASRLLEELQGEEAKASEVKQKLAKSAEDLERDVAAKQNELAELKLQTEEMQKSCSELEQTRSTRRKLLEDRTSALQTASARAKELDEELHGTENDLARTNKVLERLQEEESERSKELEDARSKLGEVQREMLSLQAQVQPSRTDDLEATSKNLALQLESAFEQQLAADKEQEKLRTDLEESEQMLHQAQEEVQKLVKEQEDAQKEVDLLTDEIKVIKSRDYTNRLQVLRDTVEVNNKELDAARGAIATRALEMEALKQVHDAEEADLRKELASIEAAGDESQKHSAELFAQLRDLEQRRSEAYDALVNAESEKVSFEKEVAKVRASKQKFVQEHASILERLQSELAEARNASSRQDGSEDQQGKEEARRRLAEEVEAEAQCCAQFREELAARQELQTRYLGSDENADAALEESLQEMSTELVKAQGLARHHRQQEEELRLELGKMKERIKATKDKLLYQEEHLKLQLETLQELDEQKIKGESEVELLTLGLHQQEEENQALLEANTQLLEEVSSRFGGNLEQWAGFSYEDQVKNEVTRYTQQIEQWKQKSQQLRRQKTGELSRRNQQHEVAVQTLQHRIDQLQKEIIQCDRCAKSWEDESKKSQAKNGPTSTGALPGLIIFQRPLPSNHEKRKALLIGVNYVNSHAPLKGCVNDIWNLHCLLRHTLRYSQEQLQILADGFDGRPRPDKMPTKANIMASLGWLISTAQPGDHLLLAFSGYGCQHPRSAGSEKCESYLVPSDFADELPKGFFKAMEAVAGEAAKLDNTALGGTLSADELRKQSEMAKMALGGAKGSYRLVSMLEVHDFISRLPKRCRITVIMDACYAILPGVGPDSPATFRKVDRGYVEYQKLQNFISRPRFLELPPLPVQHTPAQLPRSTSLLACTLHCFSGCRLKEWCAEFPIEGTVQGAFSWAFLKAMAQGHFHVGIYQFQQYMTNLLLSLKTHFKHVDQQPVVQLSADASLQDVVLWT